MPRAWTLISVAEEARQYHGNTQYMEELEKNYRYDSDVANHLQISAGDLVFIRDTKTVLGMARILKITSEKNKKPRNRCPVCNTTGLKLRKTISPPWRCQDGHEFDVPVTESIEVTTFKASYGNSFIPLNRSLSVKDLKGAAPRPNDQLSIEEVDVTRINAEQAFSDLQSLEMLQQFLQAIHPDPEGYTFLDTNLPLDSESSYSPNFADTRKRIIQSISLRRGQKQFRNKLIRRYGQACMISGCHLMEIVEAAHIWPYRGEKDNHPGNGLLLRADLHTLFDLDLLGVNPTTRSVQLHPSVREAGYAHIEGKSLLISGPQQPSAEALAARWQSFLSES